MNSATLALFDAAGRLFAQWRAVLGLGGMQVGIFGLVAMGVALASPMAVCVAVQ